MSPPLSHRAQSSAGAAPARASDDASSSPPSPTRVSAPGTPTRRRVVSGLAFDHSGEFLPALPLPEDANVDFSSAGAREAGPVLGDPNEIAGVPQAGERRSDATEKALRERGGLYASIPHLRAERESASISSNSIFSNGPRSTPYDAAIPFGSHLEAPSSPEAPSSLSSPTLGGPPSYESREANRDGVGKEKERRAKTVVKESAGVADDGKDSLRRLFKLPESEVFVEEYLCALYKKILLQGRMYVFQNHVCFYSNVFGYTKVKTIALKDVTIVNRAYTAQVVFNAIEIVHKGKCEFFTSFIFPDRTYKTITRAWRACSRYAKIFADQKTLSGAHDAERSGDGVSGGVSREARSSPEVRAMLGEVEVDARRSRTTRNANDETDGPPSSTGSLSALCDAERDDEDVLEASSKRDEDEDASLDLDARVPAFKAATVAGGGHGRRASAPALRLASSAVLAAAPAGGEELDEPSVPPSGPLSADESDEDDDNESFRAVPFVQNVDLSDTLSVPDVHSLPPLPPRPADHTTIVESCVVECSVSQFFALAWSDAAGESFTPACAEARKHRELRVTPWRAHRGYGHARDLTFVAPTNASIGPRETHCHQTQSYRVYKTRAGVLGDGMDDALPGVALVVDTSQVQKDIPYGDYFRVESRWVCRAAPPRLSPETATSVNERCEVWVGLRIPFQKTTMLRKVIEKSALEESRASVMGALALVERRLASDASLADSSDVASGLERTRVSPPRHRRRRSFADAVAETVDVSKLLIPEGSQDIIWRMLFGSKERSPRGKEDASSASSGGGSDLAFIGEADEAPDRGGGSAVASAASAADGARRLKRRDELLRFSSDDAEDAEDKTMGSSRLGVERVATSVAHLVKPARAALASLLFWKILAAALVAWLAARLVDGDGTDPTAAFASKPRLFASTAESLFSSRDSAVADVARWKRRAASLELELQALERRAAFVAGEAAHARAALADAMDRTAPEPRSAARGGFFSS
jgi:hypothetical protein